MTKTSEELPRTPPPACPKCGSSDTFLDMLGASLQPKVYECRACGWTFCRQPSDFPAVTEAREREQKRQARLRDGARRQVWHWAAAALIVALALSWGWNERQRANVATARAMAATAPKPGPQTLTLAKWEPVFEITHEPNPPAGDGKLWKYDKATIRVKVSDWRHEVYECTGPIEHAGPIANYRFQVEGGKP